MNDTFRVRYWVLLNGIFPANPDPDLLQQILFIFDYQVLQLGVFAFLQNKLPFQSLESGSGDLLLLALLFGQVFNFADFFKFFIRTDRFILIRFLLYDFGLFARIFSFYLSFFHKFDHSFDVFHFFNVHLLKFRLLFKFGFPQFQLSFFCC